MEIHELFRRRRHHCCCCSNKTFHLNYKLLGECESGSRFNAAQHLPIINTLIPNDSFIGQKSQVTRGGGVILTISPTHVLNNSLCWLFNLWINLFGMKTNKLIYATR